MFRAINHRLEQTGYKVEGFFLMHPQQLLFWTESQNRLIS